MQEDLPSSVPLQAEMEQRMQAKIVTFDDGGVLRPGGMCSCCGSGPNPEPDWRGDPWYVFKADLCDSDGVYYSMLCEGCLEEIREDNAARPQTARDEVAEIAVIVSNLLEDFEISEGAVRDGRDIVIHAICCLDRTFDGLMAREFARVIESN